MLGWLWPIVCAGCGREGVDRVCTTCAGDGLITAPRAPEGVRGAFYLGTYDGPLGDAVRRAKFRPDRPVALALGDLLARHTRDLPIVDCVVPAPSTLRSRLTRGFATSAILAAAVAGAGGVPVRHALDLTAGLKQSASSGRRQRRANLTGRVDLRTSVRGDVLLVDDVVTTGATAAACAQALLCGGAEKVWLLTVCATRVQNL